MKPKLFTIIFVLLFLFSTQALYAFITLPSTKINSLGLSIESGTSPIGIDLSYRYGEWYIAGFFFNADIGYKFIEQSINGRIGISGVYTYIGLETGFLSAVSTVKNNSYFKNGNGWYAPGWFIGLLLYIPDDDYFFTLSLGANVYGSGHRNELYVRITTLISL